MYNFPFSKWISNWHEFLCVFQWRFCCNSWPFLKWQLYAGTLDLWHVMLHFNGNVIHVSTLSILVQIPSLMEVTYNFDFDIHKRRRTGLLVVYSQFLIEVVLWWFWSCMALWWSLHYLVNALMIYTSKWDNFAAYSLSVL